MYKPFLLKYVDSLIHRNSNLLTYSVYLSEFQVNKVTAFEVIRQNVFSRARVIVIVVSSDLKLFVSRSFDLIEGHRECGDALLLM